MAGVKLKNVHKTFDKTEVVHGIDLEVDHEEFVVLVGPSGCGKTTTLRMIAGLEDVTRGDIFIGEQKVNDVQPKDRDIAMVFQNYALYPHMTVFGNMSFGLRFRKFSKADIQERVEKAADILSIRELLERRPKQLSGGQRQRVAMGRAIVRQPKVFLFDEPLSNLDAKLRVQMRMEIKRLHHNLKATIIYVTHDQVEAMTLADRIVVMNEGNIEQVGTPQQLYDTPQTMFVAGFIGSPAMNFVTCRLVEKAGELVVKLNEEVSLPVPKEKTERYRAYTDAEAIFGIRPEHLTEKRHHEKNSHLFDFDTKVDALEPMGIDTTVFFNFNLSEMCARVKPTAAKSPGETITLSVDMDKMHLIDPTSGKVI